MHPETLAIHPPTAAAAPAVPRSDWTTVRKLLPYVWEWRWRVAVALAFLIAAKLANVGVPLVLKSLVDALDLEVGSPQAVLVVPVALLLAYGALRLSITLLPNCASCSSFRSRPASRAGSRSKPSTICWR